MRVAALILKVFDDPMTSGVIADEVDPGKAFWVKRDACANHRSRSHDVSHRNGGVEAWRRDDAANMRSMIRMAPPQSGQTRLASTASLLVEGADAEAGESFGSSSPSNARHDAIFSARPPLAMNPK
jgi:hypothetical protein